ncbi:MAG: DUF1801 domain-containing protein [Bacteroidota bacterium]
MKSDTPNINSIDEYIDGFPEDIRNKLSEMRAAIGETAPDAVEVISYRMPAFHHNGVLVYFAAYKNHIGFYPTASGIAHFVDEFQGYTFSKGAVQFPLDKPLPLALIRKIVRFRLEENKSAKATPKV